mmetsp:Transcript_24075/g.75035  ORF Transcript_24075/g.75035 Transcript_24075/m.75035 type:complete len:100 (+) Transcript_24075:386-685(+)
MLRQSRKQRGLRASPTHLAALTAVGAAAAPASANIVLHAESGNEPPRSSKGVCVNGGRTPVADKAHPTSPDASTRSEMAASEKVYSSPPYLSHGEQPQR